MLLQTLAAIAGVGVLVAPALPNALALLARKPAPSAPTYEQAILRLADVRSRLARRRWATTRRRPSTF